MTTLTLLPAGPLRQLARTLTAPPAGRVAAGPAAEHLTVLARSGRGMTLRRIAATAGASRSYLQMIRAGHVDLIAAALAEAILAIPVPGFDPNPATIRRRLQALAAAGQGPEQVADAIGEDPTDLWCWMIETPIPARLRPKVDVAFRLLLPGLPGPNTAAAAHAYFQAWPTIAQVGPADLVDAVTALALRRHWTRERIVTWLHHAEAAATLRATAEHLNTDLTSQAHTIHATLNLDPETAHV
jgi:transcriptional regulator with XRE-family HTH domain